MWNPDRPPLDLLATTPVCAVVNQENRPMVICDDGSVWEFFQNPHRGPGGPAYDRFLWRERVPVPGTRRGRQRSAARLDEADRD